MADARLVANRFLELADADGRALTPMQVLKLVYIAHGWTLALTDEALIDQPVEAWRYGPVISELYRAMKGFGGGGVRGPLATGIRQAGAGLTGTQSHIVSQVYQLYGTQSGLQLSRITHADGTPWQQVYDPDSYSDEIPERVIADHYRRLLKERGASANG